MHPVCVQELYPGWTPRSVWRARGCRELRLKQLTFRGYLLLKEAAEWPAFTITGLASELAL